MSAHNLALAFNALYNDITMEICTIEGCNNPLHVKSRGWCRSHNQRYLRTGNPIKVTNSPVCPCGKKSYSRGLCVNCYSRAYRSGNLEPLKVGSRTKAIPGYRAAHTRIQKSRGLASDFLCFLCGEQAAEWALIHEASNIIFESAGPKAGAAYSLDISNYASMCVACHRDYDGTLPPPMVAGRRQAVTV